MFPNCPQGLLLLLLIPPEMGKGNCTWKALLANCFDFLSYVAELLNLNLLRLF